MIEDRYCARCGDIEACHSTGPCRRLIRWTGTKWETCPCPGFIAAQAALL